MQKHRNAAQPVDLLVEQSNHFEEALNFYYQVLENVPYSSIGAS